MYLIIKQVITAVFFTCTLFSLLAGNSGQAGTALMEGAQEAAEFVFSICGGLCLWSALNELMEECGIAAKLSYRLRPLLRGLLPRSAGNGEILKAVSENVSANLLGLGNAATPAGIRAAKAMRALDDRAASEELGMLVVLNTASIQIIPGSIAAVRAAAGAAEPFDILPAVWISSLISLTMGLAGAFLLKKLRP